MDGIQLKGRGVNTSALEVTIDADCDGVVLRFDDADRPEFWAEVRISYHDLLELLSRVEEEQGDGAD